VPLKAILTGNSTECDGPPAVIASSNGLPGVQSVFCLPNRTSWLDSSYLILRLLTPPTSPVTCVLLSSDASIAIPANDTATFGQFDRIFEIAIEGVKDVASDLDRQFHFTVRCTSADQRFSIATVRSNSAFTLNVPFPRITDVFPKTVPFVGKQITIRGAAFRSDLTTFVGRTLVSGPSIVRTIMVNETEDTLWEVVLLDPDALVWMSTISAGPVATLPRKTECVQSDDLDRPPGEGDNTSCSDQPLIGAQRRKPGGGGGGASSATISAGGGAGGGQASASVPVAYSLIAPLSASESTNAYDRTWYDEILANMAARNASEPQLIFHALETYYDWFAAPLGAFNLSNFSKARFVLPGPMRDRIVLGIANASIMETAESHLVLCESVQPFNFTAIGSELRFLSPAREQINLQVYEDKVGANFEAGYGEIEITFPAGLGTRLSSALFYTDDCPDEGYFFDGSKCRHCPVGGYVVFGAA
jgi:hypothetical protein